MCGTERLRGLSFLNEAVCPQATEDFLDDLGLLRSLSKDIKVIRNLSCVDSLFKLVLWTCQELRPLGTKNVLMYLKLNYLSGQTIKRSHECEM